MLLDDGAIIMEVTDIVSATEVKCVVTNDGEIGERKVRGWGGMFIFGCRIGEHSATECSRVPRRGRL